MAKIWAHRPNASAVLAAYLRQTNEPPWTSYFVKYSSVVNDHFGMSHFNFSVGKSNYHILRTGCYPYIKYHCTKRDYQDLSLENAMMFAIKVLNLGFPTLLYGLAATFMITHKEKQPVEEKDESSGGEGSDQEKVPKKKVPAKKQKLITESLAKKDKDKGDNEVEKESLVKLDLPDTEKTTPDGKTWNFKISSWNVAGLRACVKKNGMDYIKQENPDIIALQETKCPESKLPGIVHIDGYHTYWVSGEKEGHAGVGLYSKVKPISVQKGLGIAEHDKEGRVITAEFEKFYLVATYVVNSGQKLKTLDKRMQWNKDFHAHLVDLDKKKPVILAGDLNVAHEKIDLARPDTNKKSAGFTIEERQGFTELLEMGFVDSFRHLYPDLTEAYTFWNYFHNSRAKNVGWRLDYFVLSKRLLENLCDNVIRKDVMGSDHCPITLFLNL